jgi:hypothetical protein
LAGGVAVHDRHVAIHQDEFVIAGTAFVFESVKNHLNGIQAVVGVVAG